MISRLFIAVMVGIAVLGASLFNSRTPELPTYWKNLEAKETGCAAILKSKPIGSVESRDCGFLYWKLSKWDDAYNVFVRRLMATDGYKNKATAGYDEKYAQAASDLGGLYLDRTNFAESQEQYENLLHYDQAHLPASDPRLVRDLNNLGLICHIRATTTKNEEEKKKFAALAQSNYDKAERSLAQIKAPQSLHFSVLMNDALLLEDIGDIKGAHEKFIAASAYAPEQGANFVRKLAP